MGSDQSTPKTDNEKGDFEKYLSAMDMCSTKLISGRDKKNCLDDYSVSVLYKQLLKCK
jgi:hypothetical protein